MLESEVETVTLILHCLGLSRTILLFHRVACLVWVLEEEAYGELVDSRRSKNIRTSKLQPFLYKKLSLRKVLS